MALLPSANFVVQATGSVMAQFNYAARPITIYKEPTQNIISNPQNILFGYSPDSQSNSSQITYSSVSATYSGLILYPLKARNQQNQAFDNKVLINNNSTYIKVTESAKNYIQNGTKNEKLEFDGQTWNFNDSMKYQVQNYLGLVFYYFEVKGTN